MKSIKKFCTPDLRKKEKIIKERNTQYQTTSNISTLDI